MELLCLPFKRRETVTGRCNRIISAKLFVRMSVFGYILLILLFSIIFFISAERELNYA